MSNTIGSPPPASTRYASQPVEPSAVPDRARPATIDSAQSHQLMVHAAQAVLSAPGAPSLPQALGSEAPKLLLGLIPFVGPFILLAQAFGKVAQFAGTAQPPPQGAQGQPPGAPAAPNAFQPKMKGNELELLSGSVKEEVELERELSGSFGDEKNGGSGSLKARLSAGARADGSVTVGPDGVTAKGKAAAELRAEASARGELHGSAGSVSGEANAYATVYGTAEGSATVNQSGLTTKAAAAAGAEAGANARVCAESAPIVKLGDYEWTAGANAGAYAVAGTGASADIEATATFAPPEIVGKAGARAFAGARAGASATIGTGPFKLDVGIDARAGAGVEYGWDFSFKDGKLNVKGFAGIAAAVGLGANFNLSIDFNALGGLVAGIFQQVAMDAPPGSAGQAAAAGVASFVKAATPFVAKKLEKYASHDFLGGNGKDVEETTSRTKRDDPALEGKDQRERDAIQEADSRRMEKNIKNDISKLGSRAGRSVLT
ncbi:MAG: hypothetical protein MUC96_13930 [Myxococcaceae bacterium]|nr:hypothetical protein [Myxococcaceae bacterium]